MLLSLSKALEHQQGESAGTYAGKAVAGTLINASGDAGNVLAVNSGETGVEWITASGGGSGITNDILEVSSWDATALAPWKAALDNGHIYGAIKYGNFVHVLAYKTSGSDYDRYLYSAPWYALNNGGYAYMQVDVNKTTGALSNMWTSNAESN